jgi:hypothetical protein
MADGSMIGTGVGSALRFAPSPAVARRTNLLAAALIGGFTLLYGLATDFPLGPLPMLGIAAIAAAGGYGLFALVARIAGLATIEIGSLAIAIERKGTRSEIPWSAVESARFTIYGGETLHLRRRDGGTALHVRLDGHRNADIAEMKRLIAGRRSG